MPIDFLPYMFFSRQAPNFSAVLWSGSASSGKLSLCLPLNLTWLATSSGLTPKTFAPSFFSSCERSRKAHASRVQPGVSSRG